MTLQSFAWLRNMQDAAGWKMEGGISGGREREEGRGIPKLRGKENFWVVVQSKQRERDRKNRM